MKTAEFLNCKIDFSKKVFRPRPETEFWVEKTAKKLENRNSELKILDMFAGTGCIGISILKTIRKTKVDFADISSEATEQIKINLGLNKIKKNRYRICRSNLFEKLKNKKYDFIFANPPYVALSRIHEVQTDVLKKDPLVALFAGKDGLVMIKIFFRRVKKHLRPKGMIFMEFDPFQMGEIKRIAKEEGFKVFFRKDQFGKYRWLKAEIS